MKLDDTRVHIGGVLRCCLSTIGHEYNKDDNLEIGAKSSCKYCGTKFVLKEKKIRYDNKEYPCWEEDLEQ
jgi:DNA-directed RNA polymerase subunit RPC12/RpoP